MKTKFANVLVLGAAVLAPLFSGCLGPTNDSNSGLDAAAAYDGGALPETSEEAEITADLGALTGYVLTEEFTPIAGATVLLEEIGMTTDAALDGSYTFSLLEPDEYKVIASATGYEPIARQVTVEGGAVTRESFQLVAIPGMHPHRELFEFKAFLECGSGFALTQKPEVEPLRGPANQVADEVEPVPLFGLDGFVDRYVRLLPEEWNETQGIGLLANGCATVSAVTADTAADGYSNDAFLFEWEHGSDTIQEIVLEMAWSSTSYSGRKFSVTVEPVVPASERVEACQSTVSKCPDSYAYYNYGYTFLKTNSASPLRATITREDLQRVTATFNQVETVEGAPGTGETATGNPIMKPQNFTSSASFVVRVFGVADQLGEDRPADYALAFQQPLNLYVTQFFVEDAPEAYTAIPE